MISPERDLKPYLHTANGSARGFALKTAESSLKRADFVGESLISPREAYIGTTRGEIGDRKRSLFNGEFRRNSTSNKKTVLL